jgi:hypothetical protein
VIVILDLWNPWWIHAYPNNNVPKEHLEMVLITNVHLVVEPAQNVIKLVVSNVKEIEYLITLQNSVTVDKDFSPGMMSAWAVVEKDKFGSRQIQHLDNVAIVRLRFQGVNNAN